ncbi:ribonuclease HIII [Oceanobacillus picturae]|jgi:ribonuclease HIII|uniref:ribonuclease HIII n=1 Tax=Oceanobacillus picturae TaxID=171693 RepID=UPI000E69F036|nr:ribonuclease HIII [Oceanobacillus picturae]RIU93728.1 ribonuclease HIII [Oceanobacillus picturae]
MPQSVHTLPYNTIKKMMQHYHTSLTTTPQGAVFRAKTEHAVITAYKSGKVLFQGGSPEKEAGKWTDATVNTSTKKENSTGKPQSTYAPPSTLFSQSHIGTDEAGTGDYFGPITVAGVYVSADQIDTLKKMGVKDSKNLTDATIRKLSREIVKMNIPYTLMVLANEKYNKLQASGWSQGKMKAMLHHSVIKSLLKKVEDKPLEGVLIDQFCEPAIYKRHIASEKQVLAEKTYFMTKAESYSIAVAAGSIIARSRFLDEIDRLSEKLGVTIPKGASKKVDQVIARLITEQGEDALNQCAKTHFANTTKAKAYL